MMTSSSCCNVSYVSKLAELLARPRQVDRKQPPIRMIISEDASNAPIDVLEDFYRFDDVAPGGIVIAVKALCINIPEIESQIMLGTKRATRHGHRFAQQRPGFFEAL